MENNEVVESARPAVLSAMERLRSRDKVAGSYLVILDREWAAEMLDLSERIELTGLRVGSKQAERDLKVLTERRAALETRKDECVLEFKFRHCAPVRYEALMDAHRPTEEDKAKASAAGQQQRPWGPSFRPAFVAEVLLEPNLTTDELNEIFGETVLNDEGVSTDSLLSPGEAMELFTAAMVASNQVPRFEKRP